MGILPIKLFFIFGFSILLSIVSVSNLSADPMVIVKNHQPYASIVLPDSASRQIRNAAKVMQDYIKKSTGVLLPIVTNRNNNKISIHVGFTSFVKNQNIDMGKLDEDGFILQGIDTLNFIIVGGSDWGTEFGIYSFLERYLGVVWLFPTELGTDIPKREELALPEKRIKSAPAYLSRRLSPVNNGNLLNVSSNDILGTWGKFNKLRGRIAMHHNLANLLNPKQFAKSNPEFYPLINGKREIPVGDRWQPNFSAPGIVDSSSANIIRYFDKNPQATSYSLGINDVTTFDQGPQSLERRNGKKNYLGLEDVSDDYFKWANEVVAQVGVKYPNKKFGVLAYNNVATPPAKNIGVNPQLIPFLTYERMRWADPSLEEQGHQLTEDWLKMCPEIGWYDYAYGRTYLTPRIWFHTMQDYLIWGANHNVKYYYAELYPNWGEGPKPWILCKLLWDPTQNVDSLLDVWYLHAAGKKAAPKLKEFYGIWEKFWTKDIYSSKWNTNERQYLPFIDLSYLNAVPEEYISRSNALMEEAYSLAGSEIQKLRVSKLREMWKVYKMAFDIYNNREFVLKKKQEKQKSLIISPVFIYLINRLENDPLHSLCIKQIKLLFKM